MRWRRLLLVLAILSVAWAPRDAAACVDPGPYLGTGLKLPLGCPVVVYEHAGVFPIPADGGSLPAFPLDPKLTVLRDGMYVDATGAISSDMVQLPVEQTLLDCSSNTISKTQILDWYWIYSIEPKDVRVGDRIGYGTGWLEGIEIVKRARCPAPVAPMPACTGQPGCERPPRPLPFPEPLPPEPAPAPVEEDAAGGCAAGGGGAGLAIGLALIGRPRRRRGRAR